MKVINFMVQLPQFIKKKKTSEVPEHVFINRQNKAVKLNKPIYDIQCTVFQIGQPITL